MNLSRTAIRYELSSGSAAVLLRLYLRIQLLWILIWAASDLFLVWSGTGPSASRDRAPTNTSDAGFSPGSSPRGSPSTSHRSPTEAAGTRSAACTSILTGASIRGVPSGSGSLPTRLGSGAGDHNSRRARLSPSPRPQRPSRETARRARINPTPPALTRASPRRAPGRARRSRTR